MIERRQSSLPEEAERQLRSWLAHSSFNTFVSVVTSRMKDSAAKALEEAVQADPDHQVKIESANGHLITAQRYQACLKVLTEIKDQEKPFIITKIA